MILNSRLAVLALVALVVPLAGADGTALSPAPADPGTTETCEKEYLESVGEVCRLPNGLYLGHYADGTAFTTHGADPIPDDGDIGPLATEERQPRCANDWYQHVLYGRPATGPDRYATYLETIRRAVRHMNWILNEDGLASGGVTADYKVLCDNTGDIRVDAFTVPTGSSDFNAIVSAARAAGFTGGNADYSIFYDGTSSTACGVGHIAYDERLAENNANNFGGDYAVTYRGCWTGRTPMHENGHNQGAVQRTAPMSDLAGHCLEGRDIMCYPTSSFLVLCGDRIHFDCRFDTYFDAAPEPNEWLDSHWNIGSRLNRFIAFGDTDPPTDNLPPFASFTLMLQDLDVTVDASGSSDPDGDTLTYAWDLGDGTHATGQTYTHSYAEGGRYDIQLVVDDGNGGNHTASTSVWVTPDVAARIETHHFDGRIQCSIAYHPVQTADQCDGPDEGSFPVPIGPGVTGAHAELTWSTSDGATGPFSADQMTLAWLRPPGFGHTSGTSPVTADATVAEDDPMRATGSSGAIEVRASGRSGPVIDQAFHLCVVILYGDAQATGTECQASHA